MCSQPKEKCEKKMKIFKLLKSNLKNMVFIRQWQISVLALEVILNSFFTLNIA